jgi:hypothetical protein
MILKRTEDIPSLSDVIEALIVSKNDSHTWIPIAGTISEATQFGNPQSSNLKRGW